MNNIDPSELQIIDYLYGEMSEEAKAKFESELKSNPALNTKLEALKKVHGQMGIWKNEQIEIPNFESSIDDGMIGDKIPVSSQPLRSKVSKILTNSWMKYAAIFLGLLVFLQVSGLKVNKQGNAVMLSFGEPQTEALEANDVDAIVARALEQYAKSQQNEFVEFKNQVNSNFADINMAFTSLSQENQKNVLQLQGTFDKNLDKQYVSLQSMINEIEDNQRQELEDSFTGMVEYIENNRQKDQFKIQNAFSELATAINNQQYQTNALLTSISTEDTSLKSY